MSNVKQDYQCGRCRNLFAVDDVSLVVIFDPNANSRTSSMECLSCMNSAKSEVPRSSNCERCSEDSHINMAEGHMAFFVPH
jgi:hypothetical protein